MWTRQADAQRGWREKLLEDVPGPTGPNVVVPLERLREGLPGTYAQPPAIGAVYEQLQGLHAGPNEDFREVLEPGNQLIDAAARCRRLLATRGRPELADEAAENHKALSSWLSAQREETVADAESHESATSGTTAYGRAERSSQRKEEEVAAVAPQERTNPSQLLDAKATVDVAAADYADESVPSVQNADEDAASARNAAVHPAEAAANDEDGTRATQTNSPQREAEPTSENDKVTAAATASDGREAGQRAEWGVVEQTTQPGARARACWQPSARFMGNHVPLGPGLHDMQRVYKEAAALPVLMWA